MQLNIITVPVKCDVGGCARHACFEARAEGAPAGTGVYLCKECAAELAGLLARQAGQAQKAKSKGEKR